MSASTSATLRHDWSLAEVKALFVQPFNDLLFQAQTVHRAHFDANRVQVSTLLSIKTGACPEDCKYCPQSGHYNTGLEKEKLMEVQKVLEEAARAKAIGSPLSEIKTYLDLYGDHGEGRAQQLQYVITRTDNEITELEKKRAQIDATLAELRVINGSCRGLLAERQRKPKGKA